MVLRGSSSQPVTKYKIIESTTEDQMTAWRATEIFPLELWSKMAKYLNDSNDVWITSQVCLDFRNIFKPKFATLLFPEIIKYVMKYLDKPTFLSCREVCREWNRGINAAYQNHERNSSSSGILFTDCDRKHSRIPRPDKGNEFNTAKQVEQFLFSMANQTKNPFPGRNVTLDSSDDVYEFWIVVASLLEKYGTDIWYVSMSFDRLHAEEVCAVLRRSLLHPGMLLGDEEFCRLEFFKKHPLPRLYELQTLIASANFGKDLINFFLENCCNAVKINTLYLAEQHEHPSVRSFFNLEHLHDCVTVEALSHLASHSAPLKEVSLSISFEKGLEVPIEDIFAHLELFATTLKSVSIVGPISIFTSSSLRLNLPLLTELRLNYCGPLDVFLNLKALKLLQIREVDYTILSLKNSQIAFSGSGHNIYACNIWNFLPTLQKIITVQMFTFKHINFTRSGWQNYNLLKTPCLKLMI